MRQSARDAGRADGALICRPSSLVGASAVGGLQRRGDRQDGVCVRWTEAGGGEQLRCARNCLRLGSVDVTVFAGE